MSSMRTEYEALLAELVVELQRSQGSVANLAAIRDNIVQITGAAFARNVSPAPSWPEEEPAP